MKDIFDFRQEFALYRVMIRKKKRNEYGCGDGYTLWKRFISMKYEKLMVNENFYNYLKKELENSENSIGLFQTLTLPMEILAMTLLLNIPLGCAAELIWLRNIGMVFFGAVFLASVHSRTINKRNFYRELLEIVTEK